MNLPPFFFFLHIPCLYYIILLKNINYKRILLGGEAGKVWGNTVFARKGKPARIV
jgi:hypothetical protein